MQDPQFDIKKAFKLLNNNGPSDQLTREDLGRALDLETPYRDILFARFKINPQADTISYAEVSANKVLNNPSSLRKSHRRDHFGDF